jgi:hypothetical protein
MSVELTKQNIEFFESITKESILGHKEIQDTDEYKQLKEMDLYHVGVIAKIMPVAIFTKSDHGRYIMLAYSRYHKKWVIWDKWYNDIIPIENMIKRVMSNIEAVINYRAFGYIDGVMRDQELTFEVIDITGEQAFEKFMAMMLSRAKREEEIRKFKRENK